MNTHLEWFPQERIATIIVIEPLLICLVLSAMVWAFYRMLSRNLSIQRGQFMKRSLRNLLAHSLIATAMFLTYRTLRHHTIEMTGLPARMISLMGFFVILEISYFFVKVCRLLVFEFLFWGHRKEGVPLLLVNLFSSLLSLLVIGWVVSNVFDIKLTHILATSAVFSIVVGLALQDTLGNLVSGVALQSDDTYQIGQWIEVYSSGQRWIGQVNEISWRATQLTGFADENITIPNRIMAQSQISNFSPKSRPIVRSQIFRVPYSADFSATKKTLVTAIKGIEGISTSPEPLALLMETHESWIALKLIYFIQDYGRQYAIGDLVLEACAKAIRATGIDLAREEMRVQVKQT